MFETLFGAEMPLTVRFFLAFLIVLGLIGAAAWAVRRFGSGRYGSTGQRGRQPRLAVIDHASVDARRRLILIRRDNVEHLLLIGGPTDVVVEPNIVRAMPASREAPAARAPAVAELLPRAIPLSNSGLSDSWPLQPEPAAPPTRAQRDALTALADNLAVHPVTPSRNRPAAVVRPTVEPRAEPRSEPRPEPRIPTPPANAESPSAVDQNLAEMAHRLEAALRKPKTADAREAAAPAVAPRAASEPSAQQAETPASPPVPPAPPHPARTPDAKPAQADASAKEGKALYDSLEQEMASLLGRPASKT
jgi:hypothetical protein